MMDMQLMERARQYMEKLANGINPVDDSVVPEEDLINNVRLSRCFFYVADVLRQVIESGGIPTREESAKRSFDLPLDRRVAFSFSEMPISVTEIVKRINDLLTDAHMQRLKSTVLTEWLVSAQFLQVVPQMDGKSVKRPTEHGRAVGIAVEERLGRDGSYSAVVYDRKAQQFLLDNLDAAILFRQEKTKNQGQPWRAEDDLTLRELYQKNVPLKEIAGTLKRNRGAIRARLEKLGIK